MLAKLKTALVLLIIGAFSGGLIYIVNEITAPIIAENELNRKIEFYSEIFEVDPSVGVDFEECVSNCPEGITEITIYSKEDGSMLGVIYSGSTKNSYGDVDVLVGINNDGSIAMVVISGSTNTPNFVKKIEQDYLSPFMGQDVNDVSYDSSTGATYTYGSVRDMVEKAIIAYLEGSEE